VKIEPSVYVNEKFSKKWKLADSNFSQIWHNLYHCSLYDSRNLSIWLDY